MQHVYLPSCAPVAGSAHRLSDYNGRCYYRLTGFRGRRVRGAQFGGTAELVGERRRADLEMDHQRFRAVTPFLVPRCAIAAGDPDTSTLPARGGIIDAAFEALGIKTEGIRNA